MTQTQEKHDLEIAYIGMAKNSYLKGDIQKARFIFRKIFQDGWD